jgi:hypothetical protein
VHIDLKDTMEALADIQEVHPTAGPGYNSSEPKVTVQMQWYHICSMHTHQSCPCRVAWA